MFDKNKFNPSNLGFTGKTRKQSNGGRKNTPSQAFEQSGAWKENDLYNAVLKHKENMAQDAEGNVHAHDLSTDASVTVSAGAIANQEVNK